MTGVVWQLFNGPFIFIHVVAEANFRIYVVTEQVDVGRVSGAAIEWWELEQSFFNGAIVINMNGIFEHVVNEIWIWFDELGKSMQNFQILSLVLVE